MSKLKFKSYTVAAALEASCSLHLRVGGIQEVVMKRTCITILLTIALTASTTIRSVRAQDNKRGVELEQAEQVKQWPDKSKRFALIIGIDKYQDKQISSLNGASNDARALRDALIQYAGFPKDQVTLLASDQPEQRQPTRSIILMQMSNLSGRVPKDGLLLVAFSGHGIERDSRAFLLTADAQSNRDVTLLEDTTISVELMKKRIRDTKVNQVVLILDACRNDPTAGRSTGDNVRSHEHIFKVVQLRRRQPRSAGIRHALCD